MKETTWRHLAAWAPWLPLLLCAGLAAVGGEGPPPDYYEKQRIAESTELTKAEKVEQLVAYFYRESNWFATIHFLRSADPVAAQEVLRKLFRDPRTDSQWRFVCAENLLMWHTPGFGEEYAAYLVEHAIHGGEGLFCRVLPAGTRTAVGEIATIVGRGRQPPATPHDPMSDERLIGVLIRCLDAPDTVTPDGPLHIVHCKPGQPTGRNLCRQFIPLALARLNAQEAVPRLTEILLGHHDFYLRANAAYALGFLMPREQSADIERWARADDLPVPLGCAGHRLPSAVLLFPLGKGLMDAGHEEGIELLRIEYSLRPGADDNVAVLNAVGQRIEFLAGARTPMMPGFLRTLLRHPTVADMLLMNPGELGQGDANRDPGWMGVQGRRNALIVGLWRGILELAATNGIADVDGLIGDIARRSANPEIARLARLHLELSAEGAPRTE